MVDLGSCLMKSLYSASLDKPSISNFVSMRVLGKNFASRGEIFRTIQVGCEVGCSSIKGPLQIIPSMASLLAPLQA